MKVVYHYMSLYTMYTNPGLLLLLLLLFNIIIIIIIIVKLTNATFVEI